MKIPKIFIKEGKEYRYIKRCNKDLFLYGRIVKKNEEEIILYKECFNVHDLGVLKEMVPAPKFAKKGGAMIL